MYRLALLTLFTLSVPLSHGDNPGRCATLWEMPRCDRIRALPTCVEDAFPGNHLTVTRADIVGIGSQHAGTLEVAQFNSKSYFDRLRWKQLAKPPLHLRIPLQLQMSLPPKHAFGEARPTSPLPSCALVASSKILLQHKFGAQIDAHAVVVRLNNAPTVGYEKHVGSFTTLRYVNGEYEGFRESEREVLVAKWSGSLSALQRLTKKRVHALHPAFLQWSQSDPFNRRSHIVTSGFHAMLMLTHVCERVALFGFSGPHYREWYFAKRNTTARDKLGRTRVRGARRMGHHPTGGMAWLGPRCAQNRVRAEPLGRQMSRVHLTVVGSRANDGDKDDLRWYCRALFRAPLPTAPQFVCRL